MGRIASKKSLLTIFNAGTLFWHRPLFSPQCFRRQPRASLIINSIFKDTSTPNRQSCVESGALQPVLSLSAALTNLQLQPLATSILHWCQRIKKVEELVDPSPSKRFFNSQKSLDCGTLSNTFENVLITKYDPGRQYGKTPNDSERFWNSVKDPFWYLLIYSERHHKTLKQVCC